MEMEYSLTAKVFCWKRFYRIVGLRAHTLCGYAWQALRACILAIWGWLYIIWNGNKSAQLMLMDDDPTSFWINKMYYAISDVFNRPISSGPGAWVTVMQRQWVGEHIFDRRLVLTGSSRPCLNLSSYNYLGFGGYNKSITPLVIKAIERGPTGLAAPRYINFSTEQSVMEEKVAKFLGKEAAFAIPMGFCTNSTIIPHLVGRDCLILSDYLNHASLIVGAKLSRASIRVFKHNDMRDLEEHLEKATQERITGVRNWRKILILVEGLYSMEGELCPLPDLVSLKYRYSAYLYVDEAHSIGAIGKSGRGVCEYFSVKPEHVDILMGTFTKSFASVGGYVASDKDLISFLKAKSVPAIYGTALAPGCAVQISAVLDELLSSSGQDRISKLRENAIMFRKGLSDMGCWLLGYPDSPVAPIMLNHPCKITAFSRQCLNEGIAVVCVGYPATEFLYARARFCLSAAHTEEDIRWALSVIGRVVDRVGVDYYKFWHKEQKMPQIGRGGEKIYHIQYEPLCPPFREPDEQVDKGDARISLCSFDFLGIANDPEMKRKCIRTVEKYGCGACGPRGFYGTTHKHLKLEALIENITGTEKAVLYSYGLSTMASVIPAFRPSAIVYDNSVNYTIRMGIQLARCPVVPYRHNDMKSLEAILQDGKLKVLGKRCLLITEGLFMNTGDICPLNDLCHMRAQYGFTLLVDESLSFGVLGSTGHGVSEYFDELPDGCCAGGKKCAESPHKPKEDIMVGSLEYSLAAMGGFCCGPKSVIGTQPLAAASYCFSAAMPPYLCTAAAYGLKLVTKKENVQKLRETTHFLWRFLQEQEPVGIRACGNKVSPVVHFRVREVCTRNRAESILERIVKRATDCGLQLAMSRESDDVEGGAYTTEGGPSIRMCANTTISREELKWAMSVISDAAVRVMMSL